MRAFGGGGGGERALASGEFNAREGERKRD